MFAKHLYSLHVVSPYLLTFTSFSSGVPPVHKPFSKPKDNISLTPDHCFVYMEYSIHRTMSHVYFGASRWSGMRSADKLCNHHITLTQFWVTTEYRRLVQLFIDSVHSGSWIPFWIFSVYYTENVMDSFWLHSEQFVMDSSCCSLHWESYGLLLVHVLRVLWAPLNIIFWIENWEPYGSCWKSYGLILLLLALSIWEILSGQCWESCQWTVPYTDNLLDFFRLLYCKVYQLILLFLALRILCNPSGSYIENLIEHFSPMHWKFYLLYLASHLRIIWTLHLYWCYTFWHLH